MTKKRWRLRDCGFRMHAMRPSGRCKSSGVITERATCGNVSTNGYLQCLTTTKHSVLLALPLTIRQRPGIEVRSLNYERRARLSC